MSRLGPRTASWHFDCTLRALKLGAVATPHSEPDRKPMIRSICMNIVKAVAVVACMGIGTSACVVRERGGYYHESHREYRWSHHDDHRW